MKKRGGRFLLVLGAGLAVLAFVVVYIATSKSVGTGSAEPVATTPPMTTIAVVNTDVPAYTVLDASNVATIEVDASTAVSPTTSNPALLYGKMTLMPLTKGQPVMTNQLTTSGFSNVIEKGKRAYTVPIPERATFGGALSENDYVDLLWTHKFEVTSLVPGADGKQEEKTKELPTTKTVLENLQVLRVISLRPANVAPANGANANGGAPQADTTVSKKSSPATSTTYAADAPPQAVVVLAVTDQQAEVIKFAQENGIIDFALRSSAAQKDPDGKTLKGPDGKDLLGDHDPEKTTGVTSKVLVEQYGLLVPEIIVK